MLFSFISLEAVLIRNSSQFFFLILNRNSFPNISVQKKCTINSAFIRKENSARAGTETAVQPQMRKAAS